MGSGGFLVAATKYLGDAYYEALIEEGFLDRDDSRAIDRRTAAWRTVSERCIYGVDMNPLAVELAKVSLWLTTLAYDRPLSFFDHHLRCGNSLLGAPLRGQEGSVTSERISTIPKDALADIDKEATPHEKSLLKHARERNNSELRELERGQLSLFTLDAREPLGEYAQARAELTLDDPTQSARDAASRNRWKERQLQDLTGDPRSRFYRLKQICNLWIAPWFWPHDTTIEPPSTQEFQRAAQELWDAGSSRSQRTVDLLRVSHEIAEKRHFFHWELEFPEIFENGGFSAFIGNPPWEKVRAENKEFFTNHDPQFRKLGKQAALRRAEELRRHSAIDYAFRAYTRGQFQLGHFLRESGVYSWYAKGNLAAGDFNLFRAFLERDYRALKKNGRLAQVLQDSLYINANCTEVRHQLLSSGSVDRLIVNQNEKYAFPIHHNVRVCLLSATKGRESRSLSAAFFVGKWADDTWRCKSLRELVPVLSDPGHYTIEMPVEFIRRVSPTTLSLMELVDRRDAELLDHLSRVGIPFGSAWEPEFCAELHASGDSDLFRDADWLQSHGCKRNSDYWVHPELSEFWPLIEGRNIYQFEFPVGSFNKWINARDGIARLPKGPDGKPVNVHPRLAWRDVANSKNERSVIAAVVPARTFCKHVIPTIKGGVLSDDTIANTTALLNSFAFDVQARLRGSAHLTYTLMEQLFVPAPLTDLNLVRTERAAQEAAVLLAFSVPFELAEHIFAQFPLLDRLMQPLPAETRSTVTRDAVLAQYAEAIRHPKASFYRQRATTALGAGAIPFVPETRGDDEEHIDEVEEG